MSKACCNDNQDMIYILYRINGFFYTPFLLDRILLDLSVC